MKKTFGLDSAIKSGDEIYHVETFAEPKKHRIATHIYKSGKVLDITETPYDTDMREKKLIALIQSIHNKQIDEISNLLQLADNVKARMQTDALNKIGMLFFSRGFYDDARIAFEQVIKLDNNMTSAHRNLGYVYRKMGDIDKAIDQFTRALYLAPNNADFYLDLGLAYLDKDQYDEAFRELEKAININKDYAEAYFNLGLLILQEKVVKVPSPEEKNVMSAIVNMKYASLLDPRFQQEAFKKAFRLLENEEYADALAGFERFKKTLSGVDIHEVVSDFELFSKYSDLRDVPVTIDEYIERLSAKIEQHPGYADLRNALAKAYLIKMRTLFNAAIENFKRALDINPSYEQARKNLELVESEAQGFMLFLRAILK
ncbi:MAG: tetratricopeptide repeat protein [candidate division WOR-3 bacterium]|nr:MAG: tetratricopeptide repeat protein [candidate division WOR-3 bacterium]